MQSGYYYHPYYWANMAAGATATATSAEELAALSGQVSNEDGDVSQAAAAAAAAGNPHGMMHVESEQAQVDQYAQHMQQQQLHQQLMVAQQMSHHKHDDDEEGESANMTEATATGTPEMEPMDPFDDKKRITAALEDIDDDGQKKRRGRPKKVAA